MKKILLSVILSAGIWLSVTPFVLAYSQTVNVDHSITQTATSDDVADCSVRYMFYVKDSGGNYIYSNTDIFHTNLDPWTWSPGDGDYTEAGLRCYTTSLVGSPIPLHTGSFSIPTSSGGGGGGGGGGHVVSPAAANVGNAGATTATKIGQDIKSGIGKVLGLAAMLVAALILLGYAIYLLYDQKTREKLPGGSWELAKGFGENGKKLGVNAPKGYHYTTFKRRNGETTTYMFKD